MDYPKWVKRSYDTGPVLCSTQQEEDDLMSDWVKSRAAEAQAEADAKAQAQEAADAAALAAAEEVLNRAPNKKK
jgi:hypothetical protein